MDNLISQSTYNVVVSKGGKTASKPLKLCKLKSRSILFIEVDRENRVNIFRKFNVKDILSIEINRDIIRIKDGILPEKWESSWDTNRLGSESGWWNV